MWMEKIVLLNDMVRAFVWGAPMLVLLVGTGVYFTAKTRLFQLRHMGLWLCKTLLSCFSGTARRRNSKNAVSPFATMCTALAATVGTGNIAGVATALTIGGPGAVFWMWISAFFGMMTAFAENTLGMLYRERNVKALLDAGMSDADAYALLAENGMMVKRPLVVGDDFVLVGFKEVEWERALL